ncbi:MAG: hypothetical protein ACR2GY_07820 [Phycisphaerales bacterium]
MTHRRQRAVELDWPAIDVGSGDQHDRSDGLPTVLLRHELSDGRWHIDWLTARRAEPSQLFSLRLPCMLSDLAVGQRVPITAMPDHRPVYLYYEGPLSDGRGCVTQVACGFVTKITKSAKGVNIHAFWHNSGQIVVCVTHNDEGLCMFRLE